MSVVPLAKVVLVTRNENAFLDDFLAYWGGLFGPENVVVVDNGSDDPGVITSYRRHAAAGGLVVVDRRPFSTAVDFMSQHMQALAPHCQWLLPIETDEFLVLRSRIESRTPPSVGPAALAETREAFRAHLESVPPGVGVLKYGFVWGSSVDPSDPGYERGQYVRPATGVRRFHDQGWDKLMVRSSAFVRMTLWCHQAEVKPGYVVAQSREVGLLHYHDTGIRRAVERSWPVVEAFPTFRLARHVGSPAEKLISTSRLRGAQIKCGHKVEYIDRNLRRRDALFAFRRHLGRLPSSPEEMLAFSDHPEAVLQSSFGCVATPADIVRRELAAGRLRKDAPSAAWDDLLYHEVAAPHAFVVDCVANLLICGPEGPQPKA